MLNPIENFKVTILDLNGDWNHLPLLSVSWHTNLNALLYFMIVFEIIKCN